MSILKSVRTGVEKKPPRGVIFGPPGVGKTLACSRAPKPIVSRSEDGLGTIDVPHFPDVCSTYGDVMEEMTALITEDHPYETYVHDSATSLERLIWNHTCQQADPPQASIEGFGFGKGYVEADKWWGQFFDGCDALQARGMMVLITAHSSVYKYNDPTGDDYDRHEISLHKRAKGILTKWSDFTGFAHWQVFTRQVDAGFNKKITKGVATNTRLLGLVEKPGYDAKNRYSLPDVLPLDMDTLLSHVYASYGDSKDAPTPAATPAAGSLVTEDADHE
jgi:hypothetical protein